MTTDPYGQREQMEDPKQAKGIVDRAVVRVLTPGTLTEDGAICYSAQYWSRI